MNWSLVVIEAVVFAFAFVFYAALAFDMARGGSRFGASTQLVI